MIREIKSATIRRIMKSKDDYTVYFENAFGELFWDYISKEEISKYNIGDIVELEMHEDLTEDDCIEYCKIKVS